MSKYKDVMLDIETLGNRPYSIILSIGAVEFDPRTGNMGNEFYVLIDPVSSQNHGLKLDASTVIWWMAQNEAARKEFTDRTSEMVSLEVALKLFSKFIGKCDKNVSIWANSPSFDCSMVRNSYDAIGSHEMPWTYKQERDYRTIVGLCKEKLPATNKNIAHKAIHDCYNQIENLRFAMHQLRLVY